MAPSLTEPFLVGDPFVVVRDGLWHMWYIYGTSWVESPSDPGPARVYKIAYATSPDGVAWQRDGVTIIPDALGADECQALPTVFECDGLWHMYFCYRHATDFRTNRQRGYRLGYAWSRDLRTGPETMRRGGSTYRRRAGMPTCSAILTYSGATSRPTCSITAMPSAARGSALR